ncbi:Beauvericin cluster-specific repressor BEA4 [Fusarium oxysporum f. sp. rapae]|uniref:Beauvericin cluster-specific repressor BEA4 n=1 Tax=Fusarium oxysporum f. sp. rapae TaxID=485398 RepID=A0A8J5P1E3_FUSOX|nr:Beauvericin cluster-specific repressor BEA4 [Fusarium oxysporum f. sp. rapae]
MNAAVRKSRFGCIRCRRRRVSSIPAVSPWFPRPNAVSGKIKCDEVKPACSQCSRKGHACEYKRPALKWCDGLDSIKRTRRSDSSSNSIGRSTSTRKGEPSTLKGVPTSQPSLDLSSTTTSGAFPDIPTPGAFFGHGQFKFDFPSGTLFDLSDQWAMLEQQSSIPYLTATPFFDIFQFSTTDTVSENIHSGSNDSFSTSLQTDLNSCSTDLEGLPQAVVPVTSSPSWDISAVISSPSDPIGPSPLITDASTTFVFHYFRHIGPLFCCSLKIDNPFITDVAQRWNSWTSESLPYVLQSVSAAYLSESTPHLLPVARRLRQKARSIIEQEIESSPCIIDQKSIGFSIILLGASADWMQPRDSMLDIFQKLASLYKNKLTCADTQTFGKGIMTYWLMFLTYMSSNRPRFDFLASTTSHTTMMHRIESPAAPGSDVHPWTGTSAELIEYMTLVGELIRHHCSLMDQPHLGACNSSAHQYAASLLECRLLTACRSGFVVDKSVASDAQIQLVRLAELYQIAALMQLYRVFPDLAKRYEHSTYETQMGFKLFQENHLDKNLFSMAQHILDLSLQTRGDPAVLRFQLVPVIIAASELRMHAVIAHEDLSSYELNDSEYECEIISLAQSRRTAKDRLNNMHNVFPGDRISQVIRLISSMWESLDKDNHGKSTCWIRWLMETGQEVV